MGFAIGSLHHLTTLGRGGHIPRACRYLDFGSQNIFGEFPRPQVEDFLAVFSSKDRYAPNLTQPSAKIEALMAAADFDYIAFDMYTHSKTRKFDLNFDTLPDSMCGTFDVVANFGTSEHVANQYNVFKVAYDSLKVGGVMYNTLPFFGGIDHGLFNYHPKFFTTLVANNSYQPLYWDFSDVFASGEDFYKNLLTAGNGSAWEGTFVGCALMNVIFKKMTAAPFRPPTDFVLAGDIYVAHPTVNETLERAPSLKPLTTLASIKSGVAAPAPSSNRDEIGRKKGNRSEFDWMRLNVEVESLKDKLKNEEREVKDIRSSKSWRVTAPLRSVARWVRRLRA